MSTKVKTDRIDSIVTSIGTPGTDVNIPTEKAVRDAIVAGGGIGSVLYNYMGIADIPGVGWVTHTTLNSNNSTGNTTVTSTVYKPVNDELIIFNCSASNTSGSNQSIARIQYSLDGITGWTTFFQVYNGTSTTTSRTHLTEFLSKDIYYRTQSEIIGGFSGSSALFFLVKSTQADWMGASISTPTDFTQGPQTVVGNFSTGIQFGEAGFLYLHVNQQSSNSTVTYQISPNGSTWTTLFTVTNPTSMSNSNRKPITIYVPKLFYVRETGNVNSSTTINTFIPVTT